VKISGYFQL